MLFGTRSGELTVIAYQDHMPMDRAVFMDHVDMVFMHDKAPAHRARSVR
jgi:hypothetical protein